MADLFFSYSSSDRDRVRPIYEALLALDFDVFWDQQVPTGTDWDTWIREQLNTSRACVVFWSSKSVSSDNVRHEATVAKNAGKLVPVMIDELRVDEFPMGLFMTQAARLTNWSGRDDDPEWQKLGAEIQAKAMPGWVGRLFAMREEEFLSERKKREAAQAQSDAVRLQLDREIAGHDEFRQAKDAAIADANTARAELSGLKTAFEQLRDENQKLTAQVETAENKAPVHTSNFPKWGILVASIVSLSIGVAASYLIQNGKIIDAIAKMSISEPANPCYELSFRECSASSAFCKWNPVFGQNSCLPRE